MFCDGKTTGTFKSVDEPLYVSFVTHFSNSNQYINIVYEKLSLCLQYTRWSLDDRDKQYRLSFQASSLTKES